MSSYVVLKAVHIISAAGLFGTGLGIAFFKWVADRTGAVAIRMVCPRRLCWRTGCSRCPRSLFKR
jgi:uncharacterized membrane protein